MPKIVVLRSLEEQARGLIGMRPIPPATLFVFPNVRPHEIFHSRGVFEPFDIAFVDTLGRPIFTKTVIPPHGTVSAPQGTAMAAFGITGRRA